MTPKIHQKVSKANHSNFHMPETFTDTLFILYTIKSISSRWLHLNPSIIHTKTYDSHSIIFKCAIMCVHPYTYIHLNRSNFDIISVNVLIKMSFLIFGRLFPRVQRAEHLRHVTVTAEEDHTFLILIAVRELSEREM